MACKTSIRFKFILHFELHCLSASAGLPYFYVSLPAQNFDAESGRRYTIRLPARDFFRVFLNSGLVFPMSFPALSLII
jgi:hypothetical protein